MSTSDRQDTSDWEELYAADWARRVAGVDEVGRGACAGPMVIAACILPRPLPEALVGLTDSKKLTARRREHFDALIRECAVAWHIVSVSPQEIDERGVHVADLAAMAEAITFLDPVPDLTLTDGFAVPGLAMPSTRVIRGDLLVPEISAASVLAKVYRDRTMVELDEQYPRYGFARHKGYGTADHQRYLDAHGPCPIHRMSYANVRRAAEACPLFVGDGAAP